MLDVYIPLLYAEQVKHPGKNHFLQRVLLWHWAFATIAYSLISPHVLVNAIALLFLTLSYWCVYEIGYQENDRVGQQHERVPKLSKTFAQQGDRIDLVQNPWPWVWGMALAVPGCVLAALSQLEGSVFFLSWAQIALVQSTIAINFVLWLAFLVAIRIAFWVYNQFDESARVWIYPLLQTQRLFGYGLITATGTVGFVLLMSLALTRWVQYCIYRYGGNRWNYPVNIGCLILFVMLFLAMVSTHPNPVILFSWQAAAAFSFCLLRSFRRIAEVTATFRLIARRPD